MEKSAHGNGCNQEVEITSVINMAHKVVLPPPRSTFAKLKFRCKETFFPDDPFRHFKGMPATKKWLLALQYLFPIIEWAPKYSFSLFKSDLVSGLTIASLAIPQGISYAKLANLPPILGLYSSFVPPLVYSVLGSSRDLAVGPVSIASLLLGSMLSQAVNPNTEPYLFLQLAFTSTLFAGVIQASLGILRLGFIIDFMSKATLIGFMAGAAIIVSLQQLKSLLGIVHFTKQMGLVPVLGSVFHRTDEWSWQTIVMGICFLFLLLLARHISLRRPKLFWVAAGAPLLSVIVSTLLVFLLKGENHGISIIGKLKCGLNRPSWDKLIFSSSYMGLVAKTGLMTGIVSLTEGVAVGRTFAALKDYKVDGNKEMMAIGIMNIIGSCTSCYVTTGSFSRSAVNNNAGCKTAMSNIVMALTVMVALSIIRILLQITRPKMAILGNIPGSDIYRNLDHYRDATRMPGFLIVAVEAPINFANTMYLNERIARLIEEENDEEKHSDLHFLLLDLSAVNAVDTSGISFLMDLKKSMDKRGLKVVFINPVGDVMEKLQRANDIHKFLGQDSLFLTIGEAVLSLSSLVKALA